MCHSLHWFAYLVLLEYRSEHKSEEDDNKEESGRKDDSEDKYNCLCNIFVKK
jgi:hypothetical protein